MIISIQNEGNNNVIYKASNLIYCLFLVLFREKNVKINSIKKESDKRFN